MKPSINTIIFDLDGTLIDSRADLAASVNYALRATGQPEQNPERIISYVGNGLRTLLRDVFGPHSKELMDKAEDSFSQHYADHCVDKTVLYPGVTDFLASLNPKRKLGIVTNKPKQFAVPILEKLGIMSHFDSIFGGECWPERKPHPRPLLETLDALEAAPDQSLMVGDGHQDIKAGQAASIRTCLARYGYGFEDATLELNPNYCINNFKELKEIIQ